MEAKNSESENFDEEAEIRRLVRSISLSEKYFLFFASCNQLPKQKELIKEVKKRLKGKKIEIVEFKEPIKSLLSELRKKIKNKKPDAIFVLGLRYSIPSAKRGKETSFIANLNVSRDSFPEFLKCPMILFMPEYAITKLMNGAPDFFSVRSGIFFFENDENIMSRQISEAISLGYGEHDALLIEERQQRIENLKELLAEYQSLPENKRDFKTEFQLKDKLANIYWKTANYSKAEKLRLELLQQVEIKNDEETANQLNELASIYDSQGRYDEAIENYEKAIRIDEKTVGKEHPDYATHLNNLGNVYRLQGRYDEAIEKIEEALRIDEKTIGMEHPKYAIGLNNLGNVYRSQGRNDEAIEKFEKAMRIDEKTVGKEHPDYATRLNNLATVYRSQGRYDEAIEKYIESLRITEKTIGMEHPDYAIQLNNLAWVYYSQGKYQTALDLYVEALQTFEKFLPENHPYTIQDRKSVARCRAKLGK